MTGSAKVIQLQPEVERHVRSRLARLSKPATATCERSKKLLVSRFVKLFERIDDALFKLADSANTNEDQNLFFDAMREIRVQRMAIEKRLLDTIDESFARLVSADDRDLLNQSNELTADALSLMQHDDLEQLIALESANKKANKVFEKELVALSGVMSKIVPTQVNCTNLPVGAELLNFAFIAQIRRLDVDVRAKLVLFKVYEEVVIASVGVFCKHLLGVLTDFGLSGGADAICALNAKSKIKPQQPRKTSNDQNTLVGLLGFIQKLPITNSGARELDIAKLIEGVQKRRGVQVPINRVEQETIKLVQMLFEFVLRDRNLASSMREQICRLQIPILKVALIDDAFLADKKHPARNLLNEISRAAIEWQPQKQQVSEQDTLLKQVTKAIDSVITDFDRDTSLFNKLYVELHAFRDKELKRAAALVKRTVDAEDGKARAEKARKAVASEIDLRTMAHRFPFVVKELIFGPWSNVLFVVGLKHGFASAEWADALKVLSDLIHSVQPCQTKMERQKRIREAPNVIKRLRAGLDSISYNPFEVSEMLTNLENVHMAVIRGEEIECHDRKPKENRLFKTEEQPAAKKLLDTEDSLALQENDPFMLAVSGFAPGAWFDLKENGENLRCRLAAYIKATGKYIFVNRSGAKVAEHSKLSLALKLKMAELKPVDGGMLFDRALENVVSSLRESKSKNSMDINNN